MALAVESTCVRAVVKNTFVHVENIGSDIDGSRRFNRRNSDALHVRPSAFSAILLEVGSAVETANRACVENAFVGFAKEQVEEEAEHLWEKSRVRRKSRRLENESFHSCQQSQHEEAQDGDAPEPPPETLETPCRHQSFASEASSWSMTTCSEHNEGKRNIVPQESAGSVDHEQGLCRPCVWFWRATSCNKGSTCEYCHLCDEGAVARAVATKKAMKKDKLNNQKLAKIRKEEPLDSSGAKLIQV